MNDSKYLLKNILKEMDEQSKIREWDESVEEIFDDVKDIIRKKIRSYKLTESQVDHLNEKFKTFFNSILQ